MKNLGLAQALFIGSGLFLTLFAWVTPNHYPPWLSFHSELAAAAGAIVGGTWVMFAMGGPSRQIPLAAAVVLLASLIPLLQLGAGLLGFAGDALLVSIYVIGLGLMLLLGFKAASTVGEAEALVPVAWTVLVGSIWSVGLALWQWQGVDPFDIAVVGIADGMRPYGNLIQPNQLATLLVIGLLAAAYLFEIGTLGNGTLVILLSFFGFGIAMTLSRAGILEIIIVFILLMTRQRQVSIRRITRARCAMGVAIVLSMQLVWQVVQSHSLASNTRTSTELASAGTRPLHWETILDAVSRKPLTGWGVQGVNEAQFSVALDHRASHETLGYSHNLILDLLVWTGVPIGLALAGALSWWIWRAWRAAHTGVTLIAFCIVVAALTHAFVEFPLYYTYFLLPVGFVMGIVSFATMPTATLNVPRWLTPTLLAAVATSTVWIAADYFRLETDVRSQRFSQAHIGRKWDPHQHTPMLALSQLERFWAFSMKPEARHMTQPELDEMRVIVRRFPARNNILRLAVALALNGEPEEAAWYLSTGCAINPPATCDFMKEAWNARSQLDPELKEVVWPAVAEAHLAKPGSLSK